MKTEYVDIPASKYRKAVTLKVREKIFRLKEDGSLYNAAIDRSMSADTFKIYKAAAALDGIKVKVLPFKKS